MAPDTRIRCHYDVLDVPRDADAAVIKKAHRKKALRYHPDKNHGSEEAEYEFRLVQEAYECLSDPAERNWYDQHREAILNGGKGFDGGTGPGDISFIFDFTLYHSASCFSGFGDDSGGFYAIYSHVFGEVMQGERSGWISEGNIDERDMLNYDLVTIPFGSSSSDYADVSTFYSRWESFTSTLSFAWADQYDPREAPNRHVKRRMDDENRKARRVSRRERSEDVIDLVKYVKRRDPRVKAAKERIEKEKLAKETEKVEEAQRKRKEKAAAMAQWRAQAEADMAAAEVQDVEASRIRVADLDDSDDSYDYGGGKKGRRKGKRGKKKKKKSRWSYDDDEEDTNIDLNEVAVEVAVGEANERASGPAEMEEDQQISEERVDRVGVLKQEGIMLSEDDSESESEEEPDIWRCEVCRKDFKSEKQLENHERSKKHKEALKKYEMKIKREVKEEQLMEELLEDMDIKN